MTTAKKSKPLQSVYTNTTKFSKKKKKKKKNSPNAHLLLFQKKKNKTKQNKPSNPPLFRDRKVNKQISKKVQNKVAKAKTKQNKTNFQTPSLSGSKERGKEGTLISLISRHHPTPPLLANLLFFCFCFCFCNRICSTAEFHKINDFPQ